MYSRGSSPGAYTVRTSKERSYDFDPRSSRLHSGSAALFEFDMTIPILFFTTLVIIAVLFNDSDHNPDLPIYGGCA